MHCLLARKFAWLPLSETGTAQHFCSFSHFDGVQNVFSWLLPSCCFITFFFFFKQKQAALEALFWRWIVTILQYFRSLCFDGSVERKSSFSLPYFYLLCSNSATSQNPKSQSKGDMKTVTNVCKIFFLKKLPLRQFFLEGYLPLKKFLPFAYFSYLAQTLEEIILP